MILSQLSKAINRFALDHILLEAGIRTNANLEFTSLEAIQQGVITGLGITLMPQVAVEPELADGRLYG